MSEEADEKQMPDVRHWLLTDMKPVHKSAARAALEFSPAFQRRVKERKSPTASRERRLNPVACLQASLTRRCRMIGLFPVR